MSGFATNLSVRLPVDILAPQFLSAATLPQGAPPLATTPGEVSYRPPWQPDSAATTCNKCGAAFGFFSRRHHCRHCGLVVCGACSGKPPVAIPALGYTEEAVRVCDGCYEEAAAGGRPYQVCPTFEAAPTTASEPSYTPPEASAPPSDDGPSSDWAPPPVYPDLAASASPHPTPPADPYPGPSTTQDRGTVITPPPGAPLSPSHHEQWGTSSSGMSSSGMGSSASLATGGARVDGAAPDADAQDLEARLRAEPFSSAKLALLSAVVATNRFNSAQAASLASAFDHDSHRLTALRTLYPVVVDKQHFVAATQSVLTFATHRRELAEWITSQHQQPTSAPSPSYSPGPQGAAQPAYMPGTPSGVAPPAAGGMDPEAFGRLLQSVQQESYSASKLSLAGQALHGAVISSTQLAQISRAFSLDDDRISLAVLAYPRLTDKDGMWRVYETLGSGAAKDELRRRLS